MKKTNEKYVFCQDRQRNFKEKSYLLISSMGQSLSMSNVLTEEWKIFFFVVHFSLHNIRLLSRLLNTKSCIKCQIKLWIDFNGNLNSLWTQCFKITLLEIKQVRSTNNFLWYFYWNYVCFFASFACWKFETGKPLFRMKQ